MKSQKRKLAGRAAMEAMRARKKAKCSLNEAICVFDVASKLGADVWFTDLASLEGMYVQQHGVPRIIVSSLRPPGRQSFTCAHELGHHVFEHGMRLEELYEQREERPDFQPEEYQADTFASMLLMPKSAVEFGFSSREWRLATATAEQFYIVASWLGVGYSTLVTHAAYGLRVIEHSHAVRLHNHRPIDIRSSLIGERCPGNLLVVDEAWTGRAIDMQVGDVAIVPRSAMLPRDHVRKIGETALGVVIAATQPGVGRLQTISEDWQSFVRVSRRSYKGRCRYRHMEVADD